MFNSFQDLKRFFLVENRKNGEHFLALAITQFAKVFFVKQNSIVCLQRPRMKFDNNRSYQGSIQD